MGIYNLVYMQDDQNQMNQSPSNLKEISLEEFGNNNYFHTYMPKHIEYRQIDIDGVRHGINMFVYENGTGYFMLPHTKGVKFYSFGCDHEYIELTQSQAQAINIQHFGSMYHVHKCQKCGHINSFDSSG